MGFKQLEKKKHLQVFTKDEFIRHFTYFLLDGWNVFWVIEKHRRPWSQLQWVVRLSEIESWTLE